MNQRTRLRWPRFDHVSLFDEMRGLSQAFLVVPVNPAEHLTLADPVARLLRQINADCRIDNIIDTVSSGSQRVAGQAEELGIAPGYESAVGRAEVADVSCPGKQVEIVHNTLVAALRPDDFAKPGGR